MATQPFPYIALTDGTTTVTFANGLGTQANYPIARNTWSPTIAPLREGELGGRGPYENVIEEFICHIIDTTAAGVLAKLTTLNLLLEQARRWAKGENVAQVTFLYAPQGSTVLSTASPLKYVVYGRAPGDETSGRNHIVTDDGFNEFGLTSVLRNLRVRFLRHGVGTQSNQNASSASTNNGAVTSVTLAVESVPSPTKVALTNFGYGNTAGYKFPSALVAIAEATEDIQLLQAETIFSGVATDYSSVADAASNANGNVLRFTPTATTERVSITGTVAGLTDRARVWACYAVIRNNSATTAFKIRMSVTNGADNYTPYVPIPVSGGVLTPRWTFLGQLSLVHGTGFSVKIGLTANVAGGGQTMDIDAICLVEVSNPKNSVVAILQEDTSSSLQNVATVTIDHQLYTYPQPIIQPASASDARPYQGNPFISTKATTVAVALLGTGSANASANYWRQTSGAGAVLANVWTVTRERGYLTPP